MFFFSQWLDVRKLAHARFVCIHNYYIVLVIYLRGSTDVLRSSPHSSIPPAVLAFRALETSGCPGCWDLGWSESEKKTAMFIRFISTDIFEYLVQCIENCRIDAGHWVPGLWDNWKDCFSWKHLIQNLVNDWGVTKQSNYEMHSVSNIKSTIT